MRLRGSRELHPEGHVAHRMLAGLPTQPGPFPITLTPTKLPCHRGESPDPTPCDADWASTQDHSPAYSLKSIESWLRERERERC